jgi:proteasome lid subunit RPN8/RPN11
VLDKNRDIAFEHAADEYPNEACGVLVIRKGREVYVPCRNIASAEHQFVIDPDDWIKADESGEIVGVVHSHPDAEPIASQADKVGCEHSAVPWHIVSYPKGTWSTIKPCGYKAPLVGREWSHGILDCYSIVRDWYALGGVSLGEYERKDYWWEHGENKYLDNYEKEGFVEVFDGPERGDLFLIALKSPVPNHAAVYIGDGMILHHLQNRLSSRDFYNDFWQKQTTHVLRYDEWQL